MIGENISKRKSVLFLFKISRIGLLLCIVSIFCNIAVIVSNDGKMPVVTDYYINTNKHITATNNSNLLFLADWIELSTPYKSNELNIILASPGDIILWFSLIFMISPAIISILLLLFLAHKKGIQPH